jgi:hypothetical protein
MSYLLRILRFLQLVDDDHNLALNEIGLIIILVRIACAPQSNVVDLGMLLSVLLTKTYRDVNDG